MERKSVMGKRWPAPGQKISGKFFDAWRLKKYTWNVSSENQCNKYYLLVDAFNKKLLPVTVTFRFFVFFSPAAFLSSNRSSFSACFSKKLEKLSWFSYGGLNFAGWRKDRLRSFSALWDNFWTKIVIHPSLYRKFSGAAIFENT